MTPAAAAAAGGFPWKTAGIGAGVVTIGGIAYLASPDGTPIAPVPVAGPDEDQVYNSRIWGPTTDPIAAANRARHENKLASREALVTNRGIGRGERRDIRLGKARADVLAKYRLAGSPEAMAAMYGAQQRAVGEQAEPMLYSQLGQRNSAMNALQAQWSEEATPEGRARIEQQMQSLNAQPFSVPQGQTPDQFRQSLFPSTPVAPLLPPTVRPRTGPAIPPPGAGNATGGNGEPPLEVVPPGQVRGLAEKPTVPVFNPRLTGADAIAQEHEIKAKEKALEDWKYQAGQLERGNIPFDDPEVKQLAGPWAGLDDKRFAQRMSVRFGIPYESALQQVQAYRSRFLPGNHPGTTVMGAY